MAKLDGVISMIAARKAAKAPEYVEPVEEEPVPSFIDQMQSMMEAESISVEEIREGFVALAAGLVEIDDRLIEMSARIESTSNDAVLAKVDAVSARLDQMVKALGGIRMPEIKLPQQKDVDLRPLKSAIDDLRIMIAMQAREEREEPVQVEREPEEWVFEVKRNQSGLIKTVEVREK